MSESDNGKDLDLIPAIAPEKDELDSRRRTLSAPQQSNFRGLLVFSLVLMAVVLGIGGYALFEVQQRLDRSNELLDMANKGVRDLEARLAATGTDVSKELQTLKEQQATNFSEIDKLWRVSYRENRPAIKKLEEALTKMDAASAKLGKDIAAIRSEVNTSTAAITKARTELSADNEELRTSLSLVRGQIQDQSVQSEAHKRSIATMDQQLKVVEEAINAIDQYRQQVNQQLMELRDAARYAPASGG
jgi:chromosome segregation ATPase